MPECSDICSSLVPKSRLLRCPEGSVKEVKEVAGSVKEVKEVAGSVKEVKEVAGSVRGNHRRSLFLLYGVFAAKRHTRPDECAWMLALS